ncbi:MAG TPA: chromate resistance protein ChrB domain-containing protein [Nitrososphaerales archaeon]|nr:chromate resistance protein ChrB domain-containing protein [Nitrososphaerales archaeon]
MKWITRENAKVDRIACPWLIKKFIDPHAELLFVPAEKVLALSKEQGAISYDTPGSELTHFKEDGMEYVSFDAIIKKYNLKDPALIEMAKIVRGADAKIPDAPPESAGLEAAAMGFRQNAKDDFDNMRLQFPLYDALYRYCQERIEKRVQRHEPS